MIPQTMKCQSCGCVYTQTCTSTSIERLPLFSRRKQKDGSGLLGGLPGQCPNCGSRESRPAKGLFG